MDDVHVKNAAVESRNKVVIELSDGRVLLFSLEKLLSLDPDEELTEATPEL